MKSAAPLATSAARTSGARRAKAKPPDAYVSLGETQALLAGSAAARQQRLEADDIVSTDSAAALAGATRPTINAWIARGRAIGLKQARRGFRMPAWQFDSRIWDALPRLSQALGTKEGWSLLAFLETPLGGLGGATPREAIERGQADRVIALASGDS